MDANTETQSDTAPAPSKKSRSRKAAANKPRESARAKFERLAPTRMNTALKKISLVGNLAGSGYEYDPAQAKKMLGALTDAVEDVRRKFTAQRAGQKSGGGFAFD